MRDLEVTPGDGEVGRRLTLGVVGGNVGAGREALLDARHVVELDRLEQRLGRRIEGLLGGGRNRQKGERQGEQQRIQRHPPAGAFARPRRWPMIVPFDAPHMRSESAPPPHDIVLKVTKF